MANLTDAETDGSGILTGPVIYSPGVVVSRTPKYASSHATFSKINGMTWLTLVTPSTEESTLVYAPGSNQAVSPRFKLRQRGPSGSLKYLGSQTTGRFFFVFFFKPSGNVGYSFKTDPDRVSEK